MVYLIEYSGKQNATMQTLPSYVRVAAPAGKQSASAATLADRMIFRYRHYRLFQTHSRHARLYGTPSQ